MLPWRCPHCHLLDHIVDKAYYTRSDRIKQCEKLQEECISGKKKSENLKELNEAM